ncbi:unnamed protein product [Linum tenue]|uniref:Aspergillus nuclease S1 n=1 Tax=Linum tenue TaxID=586396 RepID=A0AAV0PCC4_9ROSI|nr:unnamed protein product [Linum tenue]
MGMSSSPLLRIWKALLLLQFVTGALGWGKEGHYAVCKIAEAYLNEDATAAVKELLPEYADGDLASLCSWADTMNFRYHWSSALHYVDTPDFFCNYDFARDCHDSSGHRYACVTAAIYNYTDQLKSEYHNPGAVTNYNLTEALLFLSHFMGDIHQPLHVGFTSDEGGNTIDLRWFRHKSNLHHVWDREIILQALKDYYDKDVDLLQQAIEGNFTDGLWHDDLLSWRDCDDLLECPNKYAVESITIACKWGYKGVKEGQTLSDEYFESRMPIVMRRIAQGGVRLAMYLNALFADPDNEQAAAIFASPT